MIVLNEYSQIVYFSKYIFSWWNWVGNWAGETEWNQADQDNDDKLSKMELISLMVRSFNLSSNTFLQPGWF